MDHTCEHMMTERLDVWYRTVAERLPLDRCDGCDRCGLRCAASTPMCEEEYRRIRQAWLSLPAADRERLREQIRQVELSPGITMPVCAFRDVASGHCMVYADRPLICRLFGAVWWLPCPAELIPPSDEAWIRALLEEYCAEPRAPYDVWNSRLHGGDCQLEAAVLCKTKDKPAV